MLMFSSIENLKLISSTHGISKPYTKTNCRKTNGFYFRLSGEVVYDFGGTSVNVKEGEVIFLPQGISYEIRVVSDCESRFTGITFQADLCDPQPSCYSLDNFSDGAYIGNHFPEMWNPGTQSDKYKCMSLFYALLAYISGIENTDYAYKKKFEIIAPAVNYLKTHIYDCSLKVDTLHLMCGISDTYFRKIFASRFGTTPQNYIIGKRIAQAESIIAGGDFDTISEVALAVGYSDPLYFSRAFKKKYGISPSNMNKGI